MPNTTNPIISSNQALLYKKKLSSNSKNRKF